MADIDSDFDVLIVGAGISGIGMAARMRMKCPDRSFAIVERRDNLGGTWDLFRYPGIRSDSDMHTLGFDFEPWKHEKSIADAPSILEYLDTIVDERGIRPHIRFGHKVLSADFDSAAARWQVTVETAEGEKKRLTANWLYLGSGYYDYDEPFDPRFRSRRVHRPSDPPAVLARGSRLRGQECGGDRQRRHGGHHRPRDGGESRARHDAPAHPDVDVFTAGEGRLRQFPAPLATRRNGLPDHPLEEHQAAGHRLQTRAREAREGEGVPPQEDPQEHGRELRSHRVHSRPTTRGTSGYAWCPTTTCSRR